MNTLDRKRLLIVAGVSVTLSFAVYTTVYLPFYSIQSAERRRMTTQGNIRSNSSPSSSNDATPDSSSSSDPSTPGHKKSNSMWKNLDDEIKGRSSNSK